jgi:glycerophosphoryl diester phosphodiesterase
MSRQVLGGARSVSGRPAVQAHRGSPDPSRGIRENTLDAFGRARALGADSVELDARLTADGALAVHHDPVIEGVGPVHELAAADLPGHVPLLADALEVCAGMVVNIEVKNLPTEPAFDPDDRCARAVAALVADVDRRPSAVVSSFWGGALSAVREADPTVRTALLVVSSFDPRAAVGGAVDLGCAAVHLPVGLVTPEAVDTAHDAGLAVGAWTVVDRATLDRVLAAGVDTVITDDVAMARQVVDQG